MYKLKPNQPDFECVDGPFEGRKYKAGQTYAEIPPNEKHRFDNIPPPYPPPKGDKEGANPSEGGELSPAGGDPHTLSPAGGGAGGGNTEGGKKGKKEGMTNDA